MKITCPRCKKSNMAMSEWPGPCKECKKDPVYLKELEDKDIESRKNYTPIVSGKYRKYPEITHFAKDQAGQNWGVDTKGRLHGESETHYDLKHDKHGWKSSGIKIKKD